MTTNSSLIVYVLVNCTALLGLARVSEGGHRVVAWKEETCVFFSE